MLLKEDNDWVKKCKHEVKDSKPRGRPKRTWKGVVQKDCQARKLNREDALDCSTKMEEADKGWLIDDQDRCDCVNVSSGTG